MRQTKRPYTAAQKRKKKRGTEMKQEPKSSELSTMDEPIQEKKKKTQKKVRDKDKGD
jgi:hypothetical protein